MNVMRTKADWKARRKARGEKPLFAKDYDPNEPRNKNGEWTEIYHATLTENVESIKKTGLNPMKPTLWKQQGSGKRYGKGEVYAFENKRDAMRWAAKMDYGFNKETGSGKVSIVTAKKQGAWEVDNNDPLSHASSKGNWLKSTKGVAPEDIISVEPFTREQARSLVKDGFNPDEPRDKDGQWTEGGASAGEMVVFHGTLSRYLQSIEEKGLVIGAAKRNYHDGFYEGERGESIYVADDFERANRFASDIYDNDFDKIFEEEEGKPKTIPVILEAHIPASEAAKLKEDDAAGSGTYTFPKRIPPEWIKAYYTPDNPLDPFKDWNRHHIRDGEGDKVLYFVVVVNNAVTKDAADRGDMTGTEPLQKLFKKDFKRRWQDVRNSVREGLKTYDFAGVGDRVTPFQNWLDSLMAQAVLGSGAWMNSYLKRSADMAIARAQGLVQTQDGYDPDQPRDDRGRWSSFIAREDGQNIGAENLSDISRKGYFYRGMTSEEYAATLAKGLGVKSTNAYSLPGEGTSFAEDVPTAESYANTGRDDPRKTGKSTYLVEVKGSPAIEGKPDGYFHSHGAVMPTRVWKMSSVGGRVVANMLPYITKDADMDWMRLLQDHTVAELQGIMEAVSQQAVRCLANNILRRKDPLNDILSVITNVGEARSNMLVNHAIIKTFSVATLETFRGNGVEQVGTIPETIPHVHVGDAARKTVQKRHGKTGRFVKYTKPLSRANRRKAEKQVVMLKELGTVNVLTAEDDRVCDICDSISEDGPYGIDHAMSLIPAHPNAVLEGTTVASYGPMHEMCRARFVGPAVRIRAGSKVTTIGPNHPMMTRRGFARACELIEGDQLLYDLRTDSSALTSGEANFEKMPMIEDVFDALRPISKSFRGTGPGPDFHGDIVFCQGEVEVIHPARQLLPVLDPCGIEKFAELFFPLSDMGLSLIAGLGAGELAFDGVGHSTASSVSSTDAGISTYRWVTIDAVDHVQFSGWAFDASTASNIYCNDGWVVKNCRCVFTPVGRLPMTDAYDPDEPRDDHGRWSREGIGSTTELRDKLIKEGYDGMMFPRGTNVDGNEQAIWVAFHPAQIKSAIGNKGTFDPKSKKIIDFNPYHAPGGTPFGGQFVSGPETGGGSYHTPDQRVFEVGGDTWNKAKAAELEHQYVAAKPALEKIEKNSVGNVVSMTGTPQSWEALDGDQQQKTENKWKVNNFDQFYQDAVDNWRSDDSAAVDARYQLSVDFNNGGDVDWAHTAIGDLFEQNSDGGPDINPFPFSQQQLVDALKVDIDNNGKPNIDFDNKKLDEAGGDSPDQLSFPDMPASGSSDILTDKMREDLKKSLSEGFQSRAEEMVNDMEPPEYLRDSTDEDLDMIWSDMSGEDKYKAAQNYNILDEDTQSDKTIEDIPKTYNPTQESGGNYAETQMMAKYIFTERAKELLQQRFGEDVSGESISEMDDKIWKSWVDSSTSNLGIVIQAAVADEFGARYRDAHFAEKIGLGKDETSKQYAERIANQWFGTNGYEKVKAFIRAKWETTQYMLDKANMPLVNLYRGLTLDEKTLNDTNRENIEVKGRKFTKLPDVPVERNGAASTSHDPTVGNKWKGAEDRKITLRAVVPRTAIISVPAYGQNEHKERESVLMGTAWVGWDAYWGEAPRIEDYPLDKVNP